MRPDPPPDLRPDLRPGPRPAPLAVLAAAVWPVSCAGCGSPDVRLCRACARPLRERGGRVAALAGTTAPGAPPTWATAAYDGAVRAAVVAWKDRGRADLDRWLVPALAEAVQAALEQSELLSRHLAGGVAGGPVLLVPVPSRAVAARERGRDAVGDLARGAAALLRRRGAPVLVVPALAPGRGTRDQVGLDAASRAGNVGLSMRALRPVAASGGAARVLLLDDVVTTGSTLAEASRALRSGGAAVVGAAAVAATQRRGHGGAAARRPDPPPLSSSGGVGGVVPVTGRD